MIHRLSSSIPSFKTLTFNPGLNVVLAEKSPGASERQTRNGAGKSSIIELVHFLLGSSPVKSKGDLLCSPALAKAEFALRFDLAGKSAEVKRGPGSASKISILSGEDDSWPVLPKIDKKSGRFVLSNSQWKSVLGALMFGLPNPSELRPNSASIGFRELFPYFARRHGSGGFHSPQEHFVKQTAGSSQVAITYLLGLDASVAQSFQVVREKESALRKFQAAAKEGTFGEFLEKSAEVRAKLAMSEGRYKKLRGELLTFRVVPQFQALESESAVITTKLADLSNGNQADRALIQQLQETSEIELPPKFGDVRRLYYEAGVVLPDTILRRFEEVEVFHRSVVENRRSHLKAEIEAAEFRLRTRQSEMAQLDQRRSFLLGTLKAGGALEQFTQLQVELGRLEAETEGLRRKYEAVETLERQGTELSLERGRLQKQLQDNFVDQKDVISDAIRSFGEISNEMYETEGSFLIQDTANGPTFDFKMPSSRSSGIGNMKIFCFDMMLMELWAKHGGGPGFLIHDSHLFDGVDSRQVARALEIGASRAERHGFQYIVTMNEDAVPHSEFHEEFNISDFVMDIRLTDASEDGGLFGFRFD